MPARITPQINPKLTPNVPHCPPCKKSDALFIKATILGVELECLVDTDSTSTIMHSGKYFDIPDALRPKLEPSSSTLRMADGSLVKPLGCAIFPLIIEEHEYEQPIIVASIDELLVLGGFDFLAQYNRCSQ